MPSESIHIIDQSKESGCCLTDENIFKNCANDSISMLCHLDDKRECAQMYCSLFLRERVLAISFRLKKKKQSLKTLTNKEETLE